MIMSIPRCIVLEFPGLANYHSKRGILLYYINMALKFCFGMTGNVKFVLCSALTYLCFIYLCFMHSKFNLRRYIFIALRIVIGTSMVYLSSAGSCDIQHTGPPVVSCRSEQCVSDILSALLLSVEECLRDQPVSSIHRVSVCGQMHGVMLWCKG